MGRAQQHFINRLEPSPQRIKPIPTAGINDALQRLIIQRSIIGRQLIAQISQCFTLQIIRGTENLRRLHKVIVIAHGKARSIIKISVGLRRGIRRIALDKAPKLVLVVGVRHSRQIQQHGIGHNHLAFGHIARMDMPNRVIRLPLLILRRVCTQLLMVFIHRFRDDVKIHPFGSFWLLIHEIRQRLSARIGQPFINRQAIAAGLRNLVALIVQEQLIAEMVRLLAAQYFADPVIDRGIGGMVFTVHLKIDVQRRPARPEIGLPLQFHIATRDRQGHLLTVLGVEGNRTRLSVHMLHRHVHNPPAFRVDRQENRIGLTTFLTQRFQHDLHNVIILLSRAQQNFVKLSSGIELGRRNKLILEAEGIQEPAQHRVVMMAKALVGAKRVRHSGQRALQVFGQTVRVGHVRRHFAHPIQIV